MKAIGIDLGTTNSVVAIYEKGNALTIPIYGRMSTPSVVGWTPSNRKMIVGQEAKSRMMLSPETVIASNKRFMGDRSKCYKVFNKEYTPVDISAFLLRYLVDGAQEYLGHQIKEAVITVPAYFNSIQKEDTLLAAEKSGLKVLMLQQEPTAAAIAYGLDQERNQTILVYDLGGGTFDISILDVKENRFIVRGLGGDAALGGDNFDEAIMDYIYKQIQIVYGIDVKNDKSNEARKLKQKLKEISEIIKIELSSSTKSEAVIPDVMSKGALEITLSRKQYKEMIYPYLFRTTQKLKEVLVNAGMGVDDISRIICVGGATKSPIILEILSEIKTPHIAPNVDNIVALGAAITAASYSNPTFKEDETSSRKVKPVDISATNITPFSLGIRLENNKMGIIIPKGSILPISIEKEFTTTYDNATETDIEVFQGNELLCSNNDSLGGFTLKGIQKAKAGKPRIMVSFSLDKNDLLTINAFDKSTGASSDLEIDKFEPRPFEPDKRNTQRAIQDIRIGVSRIGYDDVGAILSEMGIAWREIKDEHFSKYKKIKNYDIIFINCLAGGDGEENASALEKYVKQGGVLYASDCAYKNIDSTFPNAIVFAGNHFSGDINCEIKSADFAELLKKSRMNVHFDSVCYCAKKLNDTDGQVFLSSQDNDGNERPIVLGFPYKEGYVIFTAFHNYGNASEEEKELLKFIILQAISKVTKTSLKNIVETYQVQQQA